MSIAVRKLVTYSDQNQLSLLDRSRIIHSFQSLINAIVVPCPQFVLLLRGRDSRAFLDWIRAKQLRFFARKSPSCRINLK